jgi:hypothetical protein
VIGTDSNCTDETPVAYLLVRYLVYAVGCVLYQQTVNTAKRYLSADNPTYVPCRRYGHLCRFCGGWLLLVTNDENEVEPFLIYD